MTSAHQALVTITCLYAGLLGIASIANLTVLLPFLDLDGILTSTAVGRAALGPACMGWAAGKFYVLNHGGLYGLKKYSQVNVFAIGALTYVTHSLGGTLMPVVCGAITAGYAYFGYLA